MLVIAAGIRFFSAEPEKVTADVAPVAEAPDEPRFDILMPTAALSDAERIARRLTDGMNEVFQGRPAFSSEVRTVDTTAHGT